MRHQAEMLANSAESLAQLIHHHIPEQPNPALATTNPEMYQNIFQLRQKALDIINHFVESGRLPHQIAQGFETEFSEKKLENENEKLETMFPQTKDPAQRESFFQNIFQIGKKFGFQDKEMRDIMDHRLLALAHYAQLGMQFQQTSDNVYHKTLCKPSVTMAPRAKRLHKQHRMISQEKALKKLYQTGSLEDALKIDFV
ncbi:MAG: hypothetical protein EU981_02550 [Candidatus Liberibacter ctenarytainae]|uniref:Uncharacterized protein n=1 Tax=Candidatus Liberibacter ctenarytainae TaxID=2020335 RepID=A0A937AEK4_9HYPH|nr:hypothetical protein [Candidatus Liberibacter ctenarytainae]